MLAQIPALLKLRCYRTVWQMVCAYLKDPKLRQAFSVQPLLVGGNPFDTTSIYGLIHFLERRWGIHFAMGGTGALVEAYRKLAEELGITITLNTTVDKILVEDQQARGVRLDTGAELETDVVVANVDPKHLYGHMLESSQQTWAARKRLNIMPCRWACLCCFLAPTRNTLISPTIRSGWGSDIASCWMRYLALHLYQKIFHFICIGQQRPITALRLKAANLYVLAPVPNLNAGIDWDSQGPLLRQRIIESLSEHMLPDLEQHLVTDFYMTPEDFESDYLSVGGAGFSVAPCSLSRHGSVFTTRLKDRRICTWLVQVLTPALVCPALSAQPRYSTTWFLKSSAVPFFLPHKQAASC